MGAKTRLQQTVIGGIFMNRLYRIFITFSLCAVCLFSGCSGKEKTDISFEQSNGNDGQTTYNVTYGTSTYCGFRIDNCYHSQNNGDIHFNFYVPESYDGNTAYALFITLPGYEGLYFQGVAQNLKSEEFGFEAQKYNDKMMIVAPQLSDWGNTSANQTIALTEYFLDSYNIDTAKVYMNGYSGGGETMSLVLAKRPELFTAALHVSSKWDGDLQPLAESRTPVYMVIGENDEYYGSSPIKNTYSQLCAMYRNNGLTDEEIKSLEVLDVKSSDYFASFGITNQHGGGGYTAKDSDIMGWLFSH
jgi:predicted peptidase